MNHKKRYLPLLIFAIMACLLTGCFGTAFSASPASGSQESQAVGNNKQTEEVPIDQKTYEPVSNYVPNPYMGLGAWAEEDPENLKQEISLVYVDVSWAQLEPERGSFDFASLEERCQFSLWKEKGMHAVFRFYMDEPDDEVHRDIPDWLYQMTADGVDYSIRYGKGYCPDYSNQTLIREHERVIKALGERYGNDDFIAFVQLGSVGHWGEWHVHEEAGTMPAMSICKQYYDAYTKYFNKKLMLRRPFAFAAGTNPGLYNDTTCDQESTETWLKWIAEGGEYDDTNEQNALAPMPDAWKTAPIGGEITSHYGVDALSTLITTDRKRIIDLFRRSHTAWIAPYSFAQLDSSVGPGLKEGFEEVMKSVGYRLFVRQVSLYRKKVAVTMANDGVSPFYFNWDTVFRLVMKNGTVYEFTPKFDICSVLPGRDQLVEMELPFEGEVESLWVMVCSKDQKETLTLCNDAEELGSYQKIYSVN